MLSPTEIITSLQFSMSLLSGPINRSDQPAYNFSYQFVDAQPGDLRADLGYDFTGWTGLDSAERSTLRSALDHIESFLNVSFTEVSGVADPDINLGKVDLSAGTQGLGGFNYAVSGGGALTSYDSFAVFSNEVDLSSNQMWLILHELGHALGAKHAFSSDGVNAALDPAYDSLKYSLMSYTDNPDTSNDSGGFALFDMVSLQQRWGANTSTNSGDDSYSGPRVSGVDVIWDAGGRDHLDATARSTAVVLDLNAGSFSRFGSYDDVAIAFGVTLEDATGGAGNDILRGNDSANSLSGGAGNDRLGGGAGDDSIDGGAGQDTALFTVASTAITVNQTDDGLTLTSSAGSDQLRAVELFEFSDVTLTLAQVLALGGGSGGGSGGATGLTGTAGDDRLSGGEGDDLISGGAGNDTLLGEAGNDTLRGGEGNDTLNGGEGDDFIFGGDSSADLRDVIYGGGGNDSIDGGYGNDVIYGMAGNDTLAGGSGADDLQGQDGDDVITGSSFSDLVFGGAGNDFVNGGFGHDRLNGGTGADKFFHVGAEGHGSDWIQDYSAAENDLLLFGGGAATADDFQVNFSHTEGAGAADVAEAFVIYKPSGQILWALIDGEGQSSINLKIGGDTFDLLT